MSTPLSTPLDTLKGIGPKKRDAFAHLGIHSIYDLLCVLPRAYQDRRTISTVSELTLGQHAILVGKILRMRSTGLRNKKRVEAVFSDGTGSLRMVFFHAPPWLLHNKELANTLVTVIGDVDNFQGQKQMVHPRISMGDSSATSLGVWPIYPDMTDLYAADVSSAIRQALQYLHQQGFSDTLPSSALSKTHTQALFDTFRAIHAPRKDAEIATLIDDLRPQSPGIRRLALDELIALQLGYQSRRRAHETSASPVINSANNAQQFFSGLFSFAPTTAQLRCVQEILADLGQSHPMTRLLQGDVGSGKTSVAASACYAAIQAGFQCAIMVPTEILADQHFQTLFKAFSAVGIKVARLCGGTKAALRREILGDLKDGTINLVVGTHALIVEDVVFANLGLCVIDEQHRFGVEQRKLLQQKSAAGQIAHLLVMTATPIPRSLALTAYGDLAISVLDELPPGRKPVSTHLVSGNATELLLKIVEKVIGEAQKIYVVYPLIDESEHIDLRHAKEGHAILSQRFGAERVALLHGKLSATEKDGVMQAFKHGDKQILVSTTVIEVGVDVPQATCMVIMHAERFGLSQLHQLRGRVGRGSDKSHCFLIAENLSPQGDAYRRLSIMEQSNDGFVIAQTDLDIRGPGELLGKKQAGFSMLKVCNLTIHADLVEPARSIAYGLVKADPELKQAAVAHLAHRPMSHIS